MADNLPATIEQIIDYDMQRLKILIDARIATLPAAERGKIEDVIRGAMERKRDARSITAE
jgi:hypothetical protein